MSDSPEKYLRTRARSLPLGDCYINQNWQDSGMASIIVTRKHITGFLTFALFQVDLYCLGVKNAVWRFNEPPGELENIKARQAESLPDDPFIRAEYALVHNIIYGAEAYADDLGFRPHKDYKLAQFVLEEDDDRIELMEIEFGLQGRPAVFIGKEKHPSNILATLDKSVGPGNYNIVNFEDMDNDGEDEKKEIDESKYFDDKQFFGGDKPMNQEMINLSQERLIKYIGEQNFSEQELRAFLDNNVTGKKIDEVIPEKAGPKSNKEQADDLMYEAYQSNPQKGMKLAKKALEVDPENVRAWNYLAQNEPDADKALAMFEKAALIAENQLGKAFFRRNKGQFWDIVETRPYLTARLGMAECLTARGNIREAIAVYEHMLTLNPNDNQGVRFGLSDLYLMSRNSKQYLKLFKKYEDDPSAYWLYNHAFFWYNTMGPGKEFQKALLKAIQANSHVFNILTGKEQVLENPNEYFKPGDATEAAEYLYAMGDMWEGSEPLIGELKRIEDYSK